MILLHLCDSCANYSLLTNVHWIRTNRFSGFNGAYHQILASCKSSVPNGIHRPFDLFESRLECQSLGHLGVVWDTRMRRNQIMRLAAIEIYNEISSFWLWPLATPDIDSTIDRSMRRVARLVSKDYRAPVKVECCGFTLMRLCCRKRHTENKDVNNMFKGIELREGEMMEARGLTDYMEKGDNKFGGYLLEDDAYSADRRLARIENDDYTEYSRSTRGDYSRSDYSRSSRGSYSRSSYSRGYLEDGHSRGYLENDDASKYSRSRNGSRGSSHKSKGFSQKMLAIQEGDEHSRADSYSNASQSRAGSVYTEDGDSFAKKVAESMRSRPQTPASRHLSHTSRRSRGDASGYQYGGSGEFSEASSSSRLDRESIHWDEASDSQYSAR